jgi:2,3-bisphosphoglycerate-independent phosphoglycerate mutase
VTSDHPTPIPVKTHSRGMVPFAVSGTGIEKGIIKKFSEKDIEKSRIKIEKGYALLSKFLKGKLE